MTTRNFLGGLSLKFEDPTHYNGKCTCHPKHQYCIHNSNKSGCINVTQFYDKIKSTRQIAK